MGNGEWKLEKCESVVSVHTIILISRIQLLFKAKQRLNGVMRLSIICLF